MFIKRVLNAHKSLQTFEPSPRLKRAIEHHELRREEERVAVQKMLERPKTAPTLSKPQISKKAAKGNQRVAEYPSESEAYSDIDGSQA